MKKKILLVEDDHNTRELYKDVLKEAGYDVVAADNGEKGLVEAINGGFDLILLDIIMPRMDGLTFIREYNSLQPELPNGPLVMLTVLDDDPIIKGCLALGATGYLIKSSLNPDGLIKEVKNFLSQSTRPQETIKSS